MKQDPTLILYAKAATRVLSMDQMSPSTDLRYHPDPSVKGDQAQDTKQETPYIDDQ